MVDSRISFPGPGCIVECMQGNKPVPHWVLETQGDSVRLLNAARRESKIPVSRLLPWFGPVYNADRSRQDIIDILEQHRATREALATQCDIMQVWELAQGEVDRAQAPWLAELIWEHPSADKIAAMGHAALACKTHFKFNPPNFEVYDAEKAQRKMAEQEITRQREELASIGGEFFRLLWGVRLGARGPVSDTEKAALGLSPELAERLAAMIRTRLADPETHDDADAWKLLTKSLPDEPHLALHLAQAWGLVEEHHNFWLDRAGYDPTSAWAAPHAGELDALAEGIRVRSENTLMESHGPFISIDPPGTKDVDDAFCLRRLEDGSFALTLAFACPALLWPFGGPLDKAVARRSTSIYLPEGHLHMLSPETAMLFSLTQNQRRQALLLDIAAGADGCVASVTPRLGWVEVADNLALEGCEFFLGDPNAGTPESEHTRKAAPYAAMLRDAHALAMALQARRVAAGAVITERPDTELTLRRDAEGRTVVELEHAPFCNASHLLVGEFMILANASLAAWATERGIPLLYRTQDVPLPKEFAGVWTAPEDIARIVRHLPPALVETSPRPHAGLGATCYAPLTSPIRRYTDLINEGQIITWLQTGTSRYTKQDLNTLLPVLSSCMDMAGQIQRFRPRYWKLLFYKQQGDRVWWEAVVTEENDAFAVVSLSLAQITVRVRRKMMGEKVYPGQHIMVRVGKVDPLLNEIAVLDVMES